MFQCGARTQIASAVDSVAPVDLAIALALLWIAWRVLATPRLFNAVVLFIVFGLLMALAWARLAAPDIALAEAAIGAGLTGVLLLDALAHLETRKRTAEHENGGGRLRSVVAVLVFALVGVLVASVYALPTLDVALRAQVAARLDTSGVAHNVTAVLLNFRGYDTLLEVGVLLLAVLGILSLRRTTAQAPREPQVSRVLALLMSIVAPLTVLVAGYLLWAGSHRPGGAFQAGAVLAAGGVLLRLTGQVPPIARAGVWLRLGLCAGFGVFLAVALSALAHGRLLEYPRPWAGALIVLIESALTASIAFVLFALFAAAPPTRGAPRP